MKMEMNMELEVRREKGKTYVVGRLGTKGKEDSLVHVGDVTID